MARLTIGVDVSGVQQVVALGKAIEQATISVNKFYAAEKMSYSGGMRDSLKVIVKEFGVVEAEAKKASYAMSQLFKGIGFDKSLKSMSEAIGVMDGLTQASEKYQRSLGKLAALENADIQAINRKTAAVEAQIVALTKLQAKGVATVVGGNYVKQLAAFEASVQARELRKLVMPLYATVKPQGFEDLLNSRGISDKSRELGKLSGSLDKAAKSGKIFHDAMRGVSGAMGGLWMTYGRILPLMAGFATTAGTIATMTKGADLDYTARNIEILAFGYENLSKNADLAALSLADTRRQLLEINNNPFSAGELGKGVLEFSRAGFDDLEENIKGVTSASHFAYIGQMDLAKAIELVVGQMSAFKGITATQAFDMMAVVADRTSVDLQQMTESFKNVTSLGTVMKLEFSDVATALGVLGQAGIRGATAGAALNTMMYKLITPTKQARDEMHRLGIEFNAFDKTTGRLKSLKQISFDLANLTKNLKPDEIGAVFKSMVGLRGVKALGALVQMAKESGEEFNELSEAVKNSSGYLAGYFKLLEQSGKVKIDILKAEFENLFSGAYLKAEPAVLSGLDSLRDLVGNPALKSMLEATATDMMLIVKVAADGVSAIVDFFAAFPGPGSVITGTLTMIAEAMEWLAKLASETRRQQQSGEAGFSPNLDLVKSWKEYTAAVDNLLSGKSFNQGLAEAALEAEKLKNQAAAAKATLIELNGVPIYVNSEEEAKGIEKIEDYLDSIRDRILEVNATPLQIVENRMEEQVAGMLGALAGLDPQQMKEITDSYVKQVDKMSESSSRASDRIKDLAEEIKKSGGDEKLYKETIANLEYLAKRMNEKDIAEANKKMLASMRKDWQSYADFILKLQDKISGNKITLKDELRALDQSLLSGQSLWVDKARQIQEVLAEAKKASAEGLDALSIGKREDANRLLETADNLFNKYKDLQREYYEAGISGEREVGLTKAQQVERYKQILKDLAQYQEEQAKKQQEVAKTQQDLLQARAEEINKGPVDMTEGMEAAKAKWIENWRGANEAALQNTRDSFEEIQGIVSEIRMPTQDWLTSIFTMKGVFVEAVDDMSKALEAGGKRVGEGIKYTNVNPKVIADNASREAATVMEGINKVREENIKQAAEAAKSVSTAIVDGSKQGAELMRQGVVSGVEKQIAEVSRSARIVETGQVPEIMGNISIANIDQVQARITELKRQIDNLALSQGWAISSEDADLFRQQVEDINIEIAKFSEQYANLQVSAASVGIEEMLKVENAAEDVEDIVNKVKELQAAFESKEVKDSYFKKVEESLRESVELASAFSSDWQEGWDGTKKKALSDISDIDRNLRDLVNKDWTVSVKVKEARSLGGLLREYQAGGLVQALATGGPVDVRQGKYLPGYGGGDRRLLLGEDGEVMLNKKVVALAGVSTALAYNDGDFGTVVSNLITRFPRLLTGYSDGGYISASEQNRGNSWANSSDSEEKQTVIFQFFDTKETATVVGPKTDIDTIQRGLSRRQRLRS